MYGHPPLTTSDLEGSNIVLYVLYGLVLITVLLSWRRGPQPNLDDIPTVYHVPVLPSLLNLVGYASNGLSSVHRGYRNHLPGLFKISTLKHYFVITTSARMIEDIRNAPDDVLSLQAACQSLGSSLDLRQQHAILVQGASDITTAITRIFPLALPSAYDEMGLAIKRRAVLLPDLQPSWNELNAMEIIIPMTVAANVRTILGPAAIRQSNPLGANIVELCMNLTREAFNVSLIHKFLPLTLRSIRLSFKRRSLRAAVLMLIRQLKAEPKLSNEYEHPTDALAWSLLTKPDTSEDKLAEDLTTVLLAACSSISLPLTHALYDLAANPKYANPIRKEIESIYFREGWTKPSLERMRRLDSFIKESLRLNAVEPVSMVRKVLEPFTFSDGEVLPTGTLLCVPAHARHLDDSVYSTSPDLFDGFRFSKPFEQASTTKTSPTLLSTGFNTNHNRHQLSNTTLDFLTWGYGRHACPGRFYASCILKMCLAQVIIRYDVRFEDGRRPKDVVIGWNRIPNPKAAILFRKR